MPTTTRNKKSSTNPGAKKNAPLHRASVKKPTPTKTPPNKVKDTPMKLTTLPAINVHTPKTETFITSVTPVGTNKSDVSHNANALEAYGKQVSLQFVGVNKHTQAREKTGQSPF
jgi:hypothetical protein